MEVIKLIGVLIVIVGFILKLDTLAVVVVAGLATGLVAGMSPMKILETLGTAFITNRTATLFILTLPVIGICERNARGKVVAWEIKQFFHKGNQTIVEWYFKNEMNNGSIEEFDGISLVEWTKDNKIKSLKEFGCNLNNYNPYEHSDQPEFRDERASWF